MKVLTSGDICDRYQISRATLRYWRTDCDFPKPLKWSRNGGGVWDAIEVRAWRADRENRGGKRGAAVGRFRATRNLSQVARELGLSRSTVRTWLIELGEYNPSSSKPR